MPTRKRNRPSKAGQRESNVQAYSVREFFAEFQNDDACLTRVMEVRYGLRHVCRKCGKDSTFHKLANRRAYSLARIVATISIRAPGRSFEDSRTPLQTWFYAIYLFIATRHGVSGKELQRTLGVTYKTAWRIGMQIRDLMGKVDSFETLKGHVEIDEMVFGGRRRMAEKMSNKTVVMGMKERGGRIETQIIPDAKKASLRAVVLKSVEKGSTVSTDEWAGYNLLKGDGYVHGAVDHSRKE